jgi:hypothetical protein
MARLTPRDVYIASVLGGVIIGLPFCLIGIFDFVAGFNTGPNQGTFAFEGAVFLSIGSAFILISAIILPAWRAVRMETTNR